jgi:hypothetical protein
MKPGFYWVRTESEGLTGPEVIAELAGDRWFFTDRNITVPNAPKFITVLSGLLTVCDRESVRMFADWHGGCHEPNCPEDDTCACKGRPINEAINAICAEFP